jgi:hypothetical protein
MQYETLRLNTVPAMGGTPTAPHLLVNIAIIAILIG